MMKKFLFLLIFGLMVSTSAVFAQETQPSPSPSPVKIARVKRDNPESVETNQRRKNRTSGVKLNSGKTVAEQNPPTLTMTPEQLEAEKERIRRETEERTRAEAQQRETELQRQIDAEKTRRDEENAAAEEKRRQESERAEAERQRLEADRSQKEREAEELRQRLAKQTEENRLAEQQREQERERERQNEATRQAEQQRLESERLAEQTRQENERRAEEERKRVEAEKEAERVRLEAEQKVAQAQLEVDKKARELAAQAEAAKQQVRAALIAETARRIGYLKPDEAIAFVPAEMNDAAQIETALREKAKADKSLVRVINFCSADFVGENYTFDVPSPVSLSTLLNDIRVRFGVNFLPDSEIAETQVQVTVNDEPWNVVLRQQLDLLDIAPTCVGNNAIALVKRSKLQTLQDSQRRTAPIVTRSIQFKYLQPSIGGTVDVAGRQSGGGNNAFETLEAQIAKILSTDPRASVARVPGKNILIIRATEELFNDIQTNIDAADVPSRQVIIYATIYTANKNRLRDLGGNVSIVTGNGNLNRLGGFNNFPNTGGSTGGGNTGGGNSDNSDNSSTNSPGSFVPGGVRTLGSGFGFPQGGGLQAGFSGIFGTTQFAAQLNLLIQNGVAEVKNDPTTVTDDNVIAKIDLGRQIPIAIPIFSGGVSGNANLQILNAGNTLAVTPQIIEENGVPTRVRLAIQLESNEPDTSIQAQGIPTIQRRSTQNQITIGLNETVVIGGFTTFTRSNSSSKAPVLGDIPVIGYLFKRKVDQEQEVYIYFAVRAEIRVNGQPIQTYPVQIDTTPRVPTDRFFKPNGNVTPTTTTTPTPTTTTPTTTTDKKDN
jgi:type II secretory pathway component GspD/PulD (secretin)